MEPNAFVAEVYRRMSLRMPQGNRMPSWESIRQENLVVQAMKDYRPLMPADKNSKILDIGVGHGWFLATCINLGYTNIHGADFEIRHKAPLKEWSPAIKELSLIESNIGDFLASHAEEYDFIHLSHVIEHIPKYSLLYIVDAMYAALKPGGTLLMRTPNMESPCANSSLYVTLAHEYGFVGSNLKSLLHLCNFDDIQLHDFTRNASTFKQKIGLLLRAPFYLWSKYKNRLFGSNEGGIYGSEIVVTGKRGQLPPLFDARYK